MTASKACALVIGCLASLAIGCGGSSKRNGWTNPPTSSCPIAPLLTIPWQIVDNATDLPITCATAGAFAVDVDVTEEVFGTATFTQPCAANASGGQFVIELVPGPGNYVVDVFLLGETGLILSELASPIIPVGCGDLSTPLITLPVNL